MRLTDDPWRIGKRRILLPDGRSLAYVDTAGAGPAAILLHGYTDTSRSYGALAALLPEFRLIIPDLPGHGDSDEDEKADLATLAEDMETLARQLDLRPALLVGHSFGSLLALQLARRKTWDGIRVVTLAGTAWPGLGGLTDLAPIWRFPDLLDPSDPFFDSWYLGPEPLDAGFLEQVRAEAAAMPVRVWHWYLDLLENIDLRPALPEITAPVLAISGGRDPLFDARHADLLAGHLPRVRDMRLPERGHNPHWDAPEEVADLIRGWLNAVSGC
jgi:pimeloyl-ACP methyl ester carboxylesterase